MPRARAGTVPGSGAATEAPLQGALRAGATLISAAISKTRAGSGLRVFLEEFLENNYQDFLGFPGFS